MDDGEAHGQRSPRRKFEGNKPPLSQEPLRDMDDGADPFAHIAAA